MFPNWRLRLHFINPLHQELAIIFKSLRALEAIYLSYFSGHVSSGEYQNVEIVYIRGGSITVTDAVAFATDLTLKSVQLDSAASIDSIMPILRQSRKLEELRVSILEDGIHFSVASQVINLPALDRERSTVQNPRKVTMYVAEEVYLATKWALQETDFQYIALKRNGVFVHAKDYIWWKRPLIFVWRVVSLRYRDVQLPKEAMPVLMLIFLIEYKKKQTM